MIARIALDYTASQKVRDLGKDEFANPILREILHGGPTVEKAEAEYYLWPDEALIDLNQDGPKLVAYGINFQVKSFKGTMPLTKVLPETGQKVQVYVQVPHVGLLAMNEVTVIEEACTDNLQRHLDQGWRILCVCPPNAARRPDYILGRTKPEEL